MKFLWLILALTLSIPGFVYAKDKYFRSNVVWHRSVKLIQNIDVKSVSKLSKYDIYLMRRTYNITKKLFFLYWYEENKCQLGQLKIKIVRSHYDLSNHEYFPEEYVYADLPDEGTAIIFGRYFRVTNTLYVVSPNEIKYHWKRDFAHEILHYFFDECGVSFINNNAEHIKVYEFLNKHKATFE